MQWQSLGFKSDPLSTDPIGLETLDIYTGHHYELKACFDVLGEGNRRIVVEGARGVGTTSFANYVRFSLQKEKLFFTPKNEIRVDAGWQLETLLSAIIANVVREMDLFDKEEFTADKRFKNAKALSIRIAETYRSFGVDAFGFGLNYGKSAGAVTQPILVPANVLGHHLEDLAQLILSSGYKNGLLLQLNNLDIGEVHDENHLKYLFNALRDYTQTNGISWLLVGDIGLRKFIAQNVDRLDDIISYEVKIESLKKSDFNALISKRTEFYRENDRVKLPIDMDVFMYLFDVTKGRLRYIFGLLARLMPSLHIGDLTDKITLDIAKSMLVKLAQTRISRNDITPSEENILRILVKKQESIITDLANESGKSVQYVGKILNKLLETKLVYSKKHGRKKYFTPSLDAIIAYS